MALLGPNGAGKSTLIKAIAGLVPVSTGRVLLHGREITGRAAHLLVHEGLGFVPQTENVFVNLSVEDNLDLAAIDPEGAEAAASRRTLRALSRPRPAAPPPRRAPVRRAAPDARRRARARRRAEGPDAGRAIRGTFAEARRRRLREACWRCARPASRSSWSSRTSRRRWRSPTGPRSSSKGISGSSGRARDLADDPQVAALYLGQRGGA